MRNFSLDELISIERVEFQSTKERLQETYVITNLRLSKLFKKILREVKRDILPILNVKILLYALKSVPFTDETRGIRIMDGLKDCMEYQLYGKYDEWNCKVIRTQLNELKGLILYDYLIEGWLTLYINNQIEWNLTTSFSYE
ncbi:MAG: hypothetical protein ACFFDC_12005 [Promethearchaeota archaeon]